MTAEDVGAALQRSFGAATKSTKTAVSVTTSAVAVLAANPRRKTALLVNAEASGGVTLYVGDSTVTTSNGLPLAPGGSITDNASTDAWYAVCGSAANLRIMEVVKDS